MSKKKPYVLENVPILDFAAEGVSVAKIEGKVFFVKKAVPGDVADIRIYRDKKAYAEAEAIHIHSYSSKRQSSFCAHFGECGGCKWQHVQYAEQLQFKQQQVEEQFKRVGKFEFPEILPIVGSENTTYYRNKLEFSFSHKRWITQQEVDTNATIDEQPALGFHIPGRFDKIMDIHECFLQAEPSNHIRNFIRDYAIEHQLSFYDIRKQEGLLRNMILRNNRKGEWMLIMVVGAVDVTLFEPLLNAIHQKFPEITSLQYVVNTKLNDSISDLPVQLYAGEPFLLENLGDLTFRIQPKSFFQTNTAQAERLYQLTLDFASISSDDNVYDLYTGTGTIACYLARKTKNVTGIEYVEDAIVDANANATMNGLTNTSFYAGDMKQLFTQSLIEKHGVPDVIVTDPPRSGMHADVVEMLNQSGAKRIVYVSCNPATQARDIALMNDFYRVTKVQPVDMFPHTHHVENIVLLERK